MIDYTTPPCLECGQTTTVQLDEHKYNLWKKMGVYVQDAFPEKTPEERELLITGAHSDCWNRMMAHPFEEWDYDEMCANCGEPESHDMHKKEFYESK